MTYKPSPGHIVRFTVTLDGNMPLEHIPFSDDERLAWVASPPLDSRLRDVEGQIVQQSKYERCWIVVDKDCVIYDQDEKTLHPVTSKPSRAIRNSTDAVMKSERFAVELSRYLDPGEIMPQYRIVYQKRGYGVPPTLGKGKLESGQVPLKLVERDRHTAVGLDWSADLEEYLVEWTRDNSKALQDMYWRDPRIKEAFLLFVQNEHTYREIAAIMSLPLSTVHGYVEQGKAVMRWYLQYQADWDAIALNGFYAERKAG